MSDSEGVSHFTPLPSKQNKKPAGKKSVLHIFLSLIIVITAIAGMFSYLTLQKKPQTTKTPAVTGNATKVCNGSPGETVGTVNIAYQFSSAEACVACRDNGSCPADPAAMVGQPPACQNANTTCVAGTPLSCTIPEGEGSCTFSVPVPDCSVYQIDCGNGAWPNLGGLSGGIEFNCTGCGPSPTSPVPTTPVPTTPIPTTPIPTTPVPTTPAPSETLTPTPGPSATPTPGPSATPTTGPSATPTPVPPTIPQTGESRMWYLVPLGIILTGLLL